MNITDDFPVLIDLIVRMVESSNGLNIEPGEEWLNDAQTLSKKLFYHLTAMQNISSGTTVMAGNLPTFSFIDHASTKILVRAALETYMVFFFIYGSLTAEDAIFRHKIWKLAGLAERQKYTVLNETGRMKIGEEKKQIAELAAQIKASSKFAIYTPNQQKSVLSGNWRAGTSWNDLGESAGFHPTYFEMLYKYLCGYAHSSYISALQVGEAQSQEVQRELTAVCLQAGLIIMAHFVFTYSTVFISAGRVLNESPQARSIAKNWCVKRDCMKDIYKDK